MYLFDAFSIQEFRYNLGYTVSKLSMTNKIFSQNVLIAGKKEVFCIILLVNTVLY